MAFKIKSERLRKNLKQLKKKKIENEKYVKDFYLENDLAFIACNVKKFNDIIDPFSTQGYEWPTQDFLHFIESNAEYIPVEYPIVLEINGKTFTEKEKTIIRETLHDYYALKMGDAQLAISANRRKSITLLIIGAAVSVAVQLVNSVAPSLPLREAVVMLFWLFLWEGLDCLILDGKDLKNKKTEAAQMANITVTFKDEPEITEFSDVISEDD